MIYIVLNVLEVIIFVFKKEGKTVDMIHNFSFIEISSRDAGR